MGYNAPEHRILPVDADLKDREVIKAAIKTVSDALRPWTIDFHVAQNDGSVFGSGSHDKTGRHCQATDPNGLLDIAHDGSKGVSVCNTPLLEICQGGILVF